MNRREMCGWRRPVRRLHRWRPEPAVHSVVMNDQRAVERICRHLRAALGADGVAVWRDDPQSVVAGSGLLPHPGGHGVGATPVIYGDDPVAQLAWCGRTDVEPHRGLVLAAADIVAPLVASMEAPAVGPPHEAPYGI